jgi:hypothetical protein
MGRLNKTAAFAAVITALSVSVAIYAQQNRVANIG